MTTDVVVTMVVQAAVHAIIHARRNPKAIPSNPPPAEINTASLTNCRAISSRRAPTERRGRLAWFTGATLVAGALAVRAYLTAT